MYKFVPGYAAKTVLSDNFFNSNWGLCKQNYRLPLQEVIECMKFVDRP